jgi:hypothetical protein
LIRPGLNNVFSIGHSLKFNKDAANFVNVESLKNISGFDVDSDEAEEFSDDEEERMHKKGLESGEIRY